MFQNLQNTRALLCGQHMQYTHVCMPTANVQHFNNMMYLMRSWCTSWYNRPLVWESWVDVVLAMFKVSKGFKVKVSRFCFIYKNWFSIHVSRPAEYISYVVWSTYAIYPCVHAHSKYSILIIWCTSWYNRSLVWDASKSCLYLFFNQHKIRDCIIVANYCMV